MRVWVRCYLCVVLLYASTECQEDCIETMPHPEECVYQDHEGHKYDLTSIRNDDGTPRFAKQYGSSLSYKEDHSHPHLVLAVGNLVEKFHSPNTTLIWPTKRVITNSNSPVIYKNSLPSCIKGFQNGSEKDCRTEAMKRRRQWRKV